MVEYDHTGESQNAQQAYRDFLGMPGKRSIPALLEIYKNRLKQNKGRPEKYHPPSTSLSTLEAWCAKFKWIERAKIDAKIDDEIQSSLVKAQLAIAAKSRRDAQAQLEQKQAEEFRAASLALGKNTISFSSRVLAIATRVVTEIEKSSKITDKDLTRLSRAVSICQKGVGGMIPAGLEAWAQALGIEEAIRIVLEAGESRDAS